LIQARFFGFPGLIQAGFFGPRPSLLVKWCSHASTWKGKILK
jgi:hypothetical protein